MVLGSNLTQDNFWYQFLNPWFSFRYQREASVSMRCDSNKQQSTQSFSDTFSYFFNTKSCLSMGFIKSTHHRPSDHQPTDHLSLTHRPIDLKDLTIEKFIFYRTLTQLRKLFWFIIYCIWWIITAMSAKENVVAYKIHTEKLLKYVFRFQIFCCTPPQLFLRLEICITTDVFFHLIPIVCMRINLIT